MDGSLEPQNRKTALAPTANPNITPLIIMMVGMGLVALMWRMMVLGVLAVGVWHFVRRYQQQQSQQQAKLKALFYQVVQAHNGYITPLDWAMKANLPGEEAKIYLQERLREFSGQLEVNEQGGLIYYFPTGSSVLASSERMDAEPILKQDVFEDLISPSSLTQTQLQPLIQSELAKRFKVHPSTISKKKLEATFPLWSQVVDPDGISWQYCQQTKLFSPIR